FHDNPAGTILELMALYDVPIYTQIWNILPGFIKDQLESWIDDYLFAALFDAIPALDEAVQVLDDVASVSRNVQLVTVMNLRGPFGADKNLLRGDHKISGLGFSLWNYHALISLPAAISNIITLDVRAQISTDGVTNGASFKMSFNNQDFAIPYGDMLMDVLKQFVFQPAGATDLASYLNVLINCQSVASWLGNKCILGLCVSDVVSVSDMASFCTGGLNTLGLIVETAVRSLKLDLIDLAH